MHRIDLDTVTGSLELEDKENMSLQIVNRALIKRASSCIADALPNKHVNGTPDTDLRTLLGVQENPFVQCRHKSRLINSPWLWVKCVRGVRVIRSASVAFLICGVSLILLTACPADRNRIVRRACAGGCCNMQYKKEMKLEERAKTS